MEKLKKSAIRIAYGRDHAKLSSLQRLLLPFLYLASALYKLRDHFYLYGVFCKYCEDSEYPKNLVDDPFGLNSCQGYGGGDEAKMLIRLLAGSPIKICIGADRRASAA
ncbi:hypothetical protein SDJN03_14395, partial [Cucurbita argyrosperma subsp. sororia]